MNGVDSRNVRRQSTSYLICRTVVRWVVCAVVGITIALLFVWIFDPGTDLTNYQLPTL